MDTTRGIKLNISGENMTFLFGMFHTYLFILFPVLKIVREEYAE